MNMEYKSIQVRLHDIAQNIHVNLNLKLKNQNKKKQTSICASKTYMLIIKRPFENL